jgi:CoA:oxalate CoA-transferase
MSNPVSRLSADDDSAGILGDVRVLDFTRVLAGPFATMIMADLGAQIIKVEEPRTGDDTRGFGPFVNGQSAYFTSINRGKRSVGIDLRTEAGRDLARALAGKCDVLIENFRPGTMARFGLDYETMHHLFPRLVFVSISGFGQTGPYAQRPAYDVIIQAMSGLASITGNPDSPPVRVGTSISDLGAALYGAIGILAALRSAAANGHGQHLDISMLDTQVALLENAVARYDVTGEVPGPLGSRHPAITPFQFFKAADGFIVVAAGNDSLFAQLCSSLGVAGLPEDPRFASNAARTENRSDLEELLNRAFAGNSVGEWLLILTGVGVPCGPIQDMAQVMADPQIAAREMIARVEQPGAGRIAMPASPLNFSDTPKAPLRPAPALGQHTEDTLKTLLNLDDEAIAALRAQRVIGP